MRWWFGVWILGVAAFGAAPPGSSVNQTVAQVRTAIRFKQTDNQISKFLHKLKLTESLDEHTIEELQSEGVGPKSVAELERLREASEPLPRPASPPVFESPDPPSPAEQNRIVDQAREIALNYIKSLPDFIATEVVHRYSNERGGWQLKDTLAIKLTYFEQREDYQVLNISGRPTTLPYEAIGGTITQGEFGSLLLEVFDRHSAAELHWDHWTNLRGRPAHVYTFRVLAANSRYTMVVGFRGERDSIVAGQHGFVYVDRDTNQIVRITSEADTIPAGFRVRNSATMLDYDFTDVGGLRFLLPLRAEVRMGTADAQTKNEVEFQSYKKFGAESSITFEGPVPEKPAKQ
ncbi:MAG: hypothetical protein LAQ69_32185 [Acidobacteriia bacterium]|nr:hypothetical protein [Terriglobia bacterium]